MTQTRTFLLFAWLIVAYLVWDAWQRDFHTPPAAEPTRSSGTAVAPSADGAVPTVHATEDVPAADVPPAAGDKPTATPVVVTTDLLRVTIDPRGATLLATELLAYPESTKKGAPPVELLSQQRGHYFVAQSGWIPSTASAAPNHQAMFAAEQPQYALTNADDTLEVPFTWTDASGVTVRRTWVFKRNSYVATLREEIRNAGATAWQARPYRQLLREPPPSKGGGMTNPEAYSFVGAAWYTPAEKFEKLKFADYDDKPLEARSASQATWIAMLQHYFFAAWIPQKDEASQLSTDAVAGGRYLIRSIGPAVSVAPGAEQTVEARFYAGPKLQEQLGGIAEGVELTIDYGVFTLLAGPLFYLLSLFHSVLGNWGWAIIALVVMIKAFLFKLSEAQYKSFAKMRRVQPRIEALKERYGDDRQKFQTAMMELYKKEKINPMGGCLPLLVQIPIFMALYWVLLESVELRQAPWFGWIQNLTAPDPYFILPVLNLLTMYATQRLSPAPGMDPVQKKMMQAMPLVFGVMCAFFPAGLVLYWTVNGALGLLQQWIIIRRHGDKAQPAPAT